MPSFRHRRSPWRRAHSTWAVLAFLFAFGLLLIGIAYWYLFPALKAAAEATPSEKRALSAHAALLLVVVLVILVAGISLTFRFGRYFFPRGAAKRQRTAYTDAWAEAGRRLEVPPGGERK